MLMVLVFSFFKFIPVSGSVGYDYWMEQLPRDMCRYPCAPHLQSAWMGFETGHRTGFFKFCGITSYAPN